MTSSDVIRLFGRLQALFPEFNDLKEKKKKKNSSTVKDLAGCLSLPNNIRFNLVLSLHCPRGLTLTFPFRRTAARRGSRSSASDRAGRKAGPRSRATQTSGSSSDCKEKSRGSRSTDGKLPSVLRAGDKGNSARAGTGRRQWEAPRPQPGGVTPTRLPGRAGTG